MSTSRGESHVNPTWRSRPITHDYERDFRSSHRSTFTRDALQRAEQRASMRTADSMGRSFRHHDPTYETTMAETFRDTTSFPSERGVTGLLHGTPAPIYPRDAIARVDPGRFSDTTVQRESFKGYSSGAHRPPAVPHTTSIPVGKRDAGAMRTTTQLLHQPQRYARRQPIVPRPAMRGPSGSLDLRTTSGEHFVATGAAGRTSRDPVLPRNTPSHNLTRPDTRGRYETTTGTVFDGAAGPAARPHYPGRRQPSTDRMESGTSYKDHFGRTVGTGRPAPAEFNTGFPRPATAMSSMTTTRCVYSSAGTSRPPAAFHPTDGLQASGLEPTFDATSTYRSCYAESRAERPQTASFNTGFPRPSTGLENRSTSHLQFTAHSEHSGKRTPVVSAAPLAVSWRLQPCPASRAAVASWVMPAFGVLARVGGSSRERPPASSRAALPPPLPPSHCEWQPRLLAGLAFLPFALPCTATHPKCVQLPRPAISLSRDRFGGKTTQQELHTAPTEDARLAPFYPKETARLPAARTDAAAMTSTMRSSFSMEAAAPQPISHTFRRRSGISVATSS